MDKTMAQSQFNFLPSHLVIDICSYLDNESQLSALISFEKWADSFATSSELMNEFKLDLNDEFFNKRRIQDLPDFPVKNVKISNNNRKLKDSSFFLGTLMKYSKSIVNVEFSEMFMDTSNFAKLLNAVKNVEHLEIYHVKINDIDYPFILPKMKTLKITTRYFDDPPYEMMKRWMKNFKNNKSIEKLHLDLNNVMTEWISDDFNPFISTLPNLKHLTFISCDDVQPFDQYFPAKLETLETSYLPDLDLEESIGFLQEGGLLKHLLDLKIGDSGNQEIMEMTNSFLRTQKETLLDLKITKSGYRQMMNKYPNTVQFFFDEMNLRNFQCDEDKLIVNYERQP